MSDFRVVPFDGMKMRRIGRRVAGRRKTFRGAIALCRKLGARGDFIVLNARGQPFYFECLFYY